MIQETCGENLTWTLNDGTLIISGNGQMNDCQNFSEVTGESIKQLIVEEGATSIGSFAFSFCADLKRVTLPDSLSKICTGAFNFCESLSEIKIPANVIAIDKSAFCGCWSLTNIILPEKLSELGDNVFSNCASLQAIKIPAGVRELGIDIFKGCESLKSVTLPDGLNRIGAGAFEVCESLTEIKIPDSVTEIGENIFNGCTSLEKIYYRADSGFEDKLQVGNTAQLIPIDAEKTISYCGKNVFWSLDNGTLLIKKNPAAPADADFSTGYEAWNFVEENIKSIKIERGIIPDKSFFEWFYQQSWCNQLIFF